MSIDWRMGLTDSVGLANAFAGGQQRRMAADLAQLETQRKQQAYEQEQESRRRMRTALEGGDRIAAADEALVMGNHEVANAWRQLDDQGLKNDDYYAQRRAEVAASVLQLSPEERLASVQANKRVFRELGVDVDYLTPEDLTDPIITQWAQHGYAHEERMDDEREMYGVQTDRIEAENPVTVAAGGALVTRDGTPLYQAPRLESFGLDENVYEVPGTTTDGYATTTTAIPLGDASSRMGVALQAGGLPPAVVAGVLANAHHESGFDPSRSGDNGSAHGYFQHRLDRATNFQRVTGVHPSRATPEQAAQFFAYELANPEQAGMTRAQAQAILNAKTPSEAAMLIQKYYERPKHVDPKRGETANGYYQSVYGRQTQTQGQRTTQSGMRQVQQGVQRPTTRAAGAVGPSGLTPKQEQAARTGNADLDAIDSQISEVESLLGRLEKDGWSGPLGGLMPGNWDEDSDVYDTAVGLLRPMLKGVIRGPGEGAWTDADQRVLDAALPLRNKTPAGRAQAIRQARALLNQKRGAYAQGQQRQQQQQSGGQYRVGQVLVNPSTGQKVQLQGDGSWKPVR